jgi:hypothetical protein
MTRRPALRCLGWLALAAAGAASPRAQEGPRLRLPVACEIGRTCFVQHYVDADPGAGAKDFRCGSLTYDGHDGTDFRVPTLAAQQAGVDVVAPADGEVLRLRDGVPDVSVRDAGPESVKDTECGNGLVIAHEAGLETQYCHLAQGSLAVKRGERVEAGRRLGRIGLSGLTEFPHLHFTVRRNNQVVDPFAPSAAPGQCGGGGASLWSAEAEAALAYRPLSVLNAGFATGRVTMEAIEAGEAGRAPVNAAAPAVVAFVRAIGLQAGDVQRLALSGPDGGVLRSSEAPALPRNQAQNMMFVGLPRPPEGWAPGRYEATYTVIRKGETLATHVARVDLR